jgi:hypothetical protein
MAGWLVLDGSIATRGATLQHLGLLLAVVLFEDVDCPCLPLLSLLLTGARLSRPVMAHSSQVHCSLAY